MKKTLTILALVFISSGAYAQSAEAEASKKHVCTETCNHGEEKKTEAKSCCSEGKTEGKECSGHGDKKHGKKSEQHASATQEGKKSCCSGEEKKASCGHH
ncbi:MAG: hypothetical protein RL754_1116 [Bacteroidota bacterium]